MATTTNTDSQKKLNTALATLRAGGEVYINKNSRARLIDGKIVVWNPEVINGFSLQAGNAALSKQRVAAAYKAGKIGFLTQSQLSDALNPTKPTVPKPPASKQPKKKLKGTADDDKGKKKEAAPTAKVRTEADPDLSPGKRLKNPLGALSSYNYQLSLYMITPDALELFKETGYRNINTVGVKYAGTNSPLVANDTITAGAYIVAQSGGVNSTEKRAPSFNFDYSIDNLNFEIAGPKETGTATANYNFNFTITEPYGFSFITNLKRSADAIKDYNSRLVKKQKEVAKKKAAAQQQRTKAKKAQQGKSSPRLAQSGAAKPGTPATPTTTPAAPNNNTRFQSNNDILAGARPKATGGTTPKSGASGGRAAATTSGASQAKQAENDEARKSAAKKSAGNATGKSTNSGTSSPQNPTRNFFVLGIRFFGYNASGQPVRGTDTTAATNVSGVPIGQQEIDPGNNSYALFERYYPIIITSVKTTVDGRQTVYNITAAPHELQAMGTKRGMINNPFEITASTVGEALDKLTANLNKEQKAMNNKTGSGYTYNIKFASQADADRIRSARIVSQADLDKYKWPGSGAKKTKESNSNTETTKNSKPKNTSRTIKVKKNTPIIQQINEIIAQSSFLEDAMRTVFTTALEPDQDKTGLPQLEKSGKKTIEWYHVTPDVSNLVWDEDRADWIYDIDYILNVYDTPVLDTAYTNPGKKYYGPVKRYEYWYTGTNTEVLRYKQELDNAYYNVFINEDFDKNNKKANQNGGQNTKNASGGSGNGAGATTPLVQNQKNEQSGLGKAGLAMEAQNSYLTSLFDPNAQAMAEVEILGDPDWLMSTAKTGFGNNESTVYNKFYGNNPYSVSPAGGQVFFEIDFKEAIDYKSAGRNIEVGNGLGVSGAPGTMSINSSIMFWKDPKSISKLVKGLSYSLTRCKNIFSNGTFKQVLYGNLNTFGDSASNDDGKARENKGTSRNNSGPNKGNAKATTQNTGFKNADLFEAAKRYSNDPKIRNEAWNKELARRKAANNQPNKNVPPSSKKPNTTET